MDLSDIEQIGLLDWVLLSFKESSGKNTAGIFTRESQESIDEFERQNFEDSKVKGFFMFDIYPFSYCF